MQGIDKLETLVASWYKDLPHLPENGRKWLASNVWWLVLIGVVLGAIALFGVLMVSFFASTLMVAVGGAYGAALGGITIIATLIFLALGIVSLVLALLAISPLKAGYKKGWRLLFLVVLVNVAALVIDFITSFNLFGLIWGLLMTAVGVYFLFEIRNHFVQAPTVKQPNLKKAA